MSPESRPPLTDSPWFWVLAFSLMALAALVAISGKYGRRQAAIERQFQAREHVARHAPQRTSEGAVRPPPEYAMPGDNLVPLWPLALILSAVATLAVVMLFRSRRSAGPSLRQDVPP